MLPAAYCVHRSFDPAGPATCCADRHYFLYAFEGVMRLEADGQRWTLPPARAALIAANHAVQVTLVSHLTSASVLFDAAMMSPRAPLAVFDVSPLAQELVGACRNWNEARPQDGYARLLFRMLAAEIERLAETPSPCVLPRPVSRALARALELTEKAIAHQSDFGAIARAVGLSPRTLARRFQDEMGMTWREAQRRIRVIRAVELLASTGMTVTEVSLETGYRSLSAFNSAFRDLMGVPPSMYRRTMMSRSQSTEASTLPIVPEARAFDVNATHGNLKRLPVR